MTLSLSLFAAEASRGGGFGSVALPVIAIFFLVIINGMFVAAEFALVGARASRLERMADGGSSAARWLLDVFTRHAGKDSYIAVAQLGITLASIGLGMYGEPAIAKWFYSPLEDLGVPDTFSHTLGFIIALSIITFLHVVFGEMIPKALALQSPEAVSVKLNPLMRAFSALFKPMVAVLNSIAFALMRMLRIPEPDKAMSLHTSDELTIVTDESAESGELGGLQRDLIRNIFELSEHPAEEMMVSRSHILAIDKSASADDIERLLVESPRSRYPVIDGDLDHVVGLLHVKDFIRVAHSNTFTSVSDIAREVPAVAASTSAEDLLDRFKQAGTHAALVIDEFGATIGLVSLDDVIAEVMEDEQLEEVVTHDDGSMSVDGETPLSDLREHLGNAAFDNNDVVTIAGLVLADHGAVPEVGTTLRHGPYDVTVESLDGRQITKVRIKQIEDLADANASADQPHDNHDH